MRFFASGESQILLSFQFWLGSATVSNISECCEAIYQVLSENCLRSPKSPEEWKTIAQHWWYLKIHGICRTSLAQSMGNMFELNVQKTLEAYTTTARDFLVLFYSLSAMLITALRCSTLVNMAVITIAVSLFSAIFTADHNQSQLKAVILTPYPIS